AGKNPMAATGRGPTAGARAAAAAGRGPDGTRDPAARRRRARAGQPVLRLAGGGRAAAAASSARAQDPQAPPGARPAADRARPPFATSGLNVCATRWPGSEPPSNSRDAPRLGKGVRHCHISHFRLATSARHIRLGEPAGKIKPTTWIWQRMDTTKDVEASPAV